MSGGVVEQELITHERKDDREVGEEQGPGGMDFTELCQARVNAEYLEEDEELSTSHEVVDWLRKNGWGQMKAYWLDAFKKDLLNL